MPHIDNSISGLVNEALDTLYGKVTKSMFEQIFAITNNPGSAMQQSLTKLDEEANRLDEADERMEADNAQLLLTLAAFVAMMLAVEALILANDQNIELSGQSLAVGAVTAKVFITISAALAAAGINPVTSLAAFQAELLEAGITNWVVPSAVDIASAFVNSPEWIAKMEGWGAGYAERTKNTLLMGIADGAGPLATAAKMRQRAQDLPLSAAENLTRTLQLTSYREASVAMEVKNSEFLEYKIRIAKLDLKTCLACIALHGTRLEIGERVDDHYRGRCTEFYVVKDGERLPGVMQSDSLPGERNFVPFQNGEDWFNGLSPERRAQQASFLNTPAKLRAFKSGVPLSDFVGDNFDDVFGEQIIENSLVGMLGDAAEKFYNINQ